MTVGQTSKTCSLCENPSLLQSQLDTLDVPGEDEAMTVGIEHVPEAIVEEIVARLKAIDTP